MKGGQSLGCLIHWIISTSNKNEGDFRTSPGDQNLEKLNNYS